MADEVEFLLNHNADATITDDQGLLAEQVATSDTLRE